MLIAWRKRNGHTRQDAARILCCTAQTIRQWERRRALPRLLSLNQLASRAGVHRATVMALSRGVQRTNSESPLTMASVLAKEYRPDFRHVTLAHVRAAPD